jgi:hypothetical protein
MENPELIPDNGWTGWGSRGTWFGTGVCVGLLLYAVSSGPARSIWPSEHWCGARSDFGVSKAEHPWTEPAATIYMPLTWLRNRTVLQRPLDLYWSLFARENFYSDEFVGHWQALKHSRLGMAIRRSVGHGR